MSFTHYSRFQSYHNLIGLYDLSDKYKFSKVTFNQLKSMIMSCQSYKFPVNILISTLFKEFLSSKRFYNNKRFKNKFEGTQTTLRKSMLFDCLEGFINFHFLNKEKSIFFSCNNLYLNLILGLSINSILYNHFTENFNLQKSLLKYFLILNFQEKSCLLNTFLSYYFIPK